MFGRGRRGGRGRSEAWVPVPGDAPISTPSNGYLLASSEVFNGEDVRYGGGRGRGRGRGREAAAQPSASGLESGPGRGRGRGRSTGTGVWIPKESTALANAEAGTDILSNAGAPARQAASSTPLTSSSNSVTQPDAHANTAATSALSAATAAMADLNRNYGSRPLRLATSASQRSRDSNDADHTAAGPPAITSALAGQHIQRSSSGGTEEKEHKEQARAVSSRFCPVRGMQQVLSQLSRQASQEGALPPPGHNFDANSGTNTLFMSSSSVEASAAAAGAPTSSAVAAAPAGPPAVPVPKPARSSASRGAAMGSATSSSQDWRASSLQTSAVGNSNSSSSSLRPTAAPFTDPKVHQITDTSFGPAGTGTYGTGGSGASISSNRVNFSAQAPAFAHGSSQVTSNSGWSASSSSSRSGLSGGAAAFVGGSSFSGSSSNRAGSLSVGAPAFQPGAQLQQQQQQQHMQEDAASAAAAAFQAAAMVDLHSVGVSTARGHGRVISLPAEAGRGRGRGRAAAVIDGGQSSSWLMQPAATAAMEVGRGRGRGRVAAAATSGSHSSSGFVASAATSGRGRGLGRTTAAAAAAAEGGRGSSGLMEPAAAAAASAMTGTAERSGGRGGQAGSGAHADDFRRLSDLTAAAVAIGGSSIGSSSAGGRGTSSSSNSGRGRGRGRGRDMSGYTYAGSRVVSLPVDLNAAAAASLAAIVDDSFGTLPINDAAEASPAAVTSVLDGSPAYEGALLGHTDSGSASIEQQQQQQQSSSHHAETSVHVREQQQHAAAAAVADAAGNAPAASPAAATAVAAAAKKEEPVELLTCVVCLEHPASVAVGPCDHHQLCALCCLRLRLCYQDIRCPLCKTEAKQVVIVTAPKRGHSIPSYSHLMNQQAILWHKPRWAPGVMTRPKDMLPSTHSRSGFIPLHVRLMQMTAVACPECDKTGQHPLQNMKALQDHLRMMHHGLTMCPTCVKARRRFPLELETYTAEGLAAHNAAAHKHCDFCDLWFYAIDEMWAHMHQRHFLCSICQAAGTPHLYFKDSAGLQEHYAAKHFPCTEGECAESGMVAFATEQELKEHQLERHSSKMPRFKKSNARQLMLDLPTMIPRHAGRNSSWRDQQQNEERLRGGAGSSSSSAAGLDGSSSSRGVRGGSRGGGRGRGGRESMQEQQQQHDSSSNSANNPLASVEQWPSVEAAAAGVSAPAAAASDSDQTFGGRSASAGNGRHQTRSQQAVAPAASNGTSSSSSSNPSQSIGSSSKAAAATNTATLAAAGAAAIANSSCSTTAEADGHHANGQNAAAAAAAVAAAAMDPYAHATSLREGGMHIIDDDVGMNYDFSQYRQQEQEQQQRQQQQEQQWLAPSADGPTFAASSSRPVAAGSSSNIAAEFPDLAAAAAAGPSGSSRTSGSSKAAAEAASGAAGAQLVKATAKCACGRKQIHCVVRQGQQPEPLLCDKQCAVQQRRSQIADAFGVEDAEQHAAYWDKHRTPSYSPQLLQAYKTDPIFIEDLERQFVEFLSSSKSSRLTLGAMSKAQRTLVHEYAEQGFGCVSHSTGVEPNRVVQVFKTPSSGAPQQLLSQAGVRISQQAIDNMLQQQAASALTLKLVDVTPGANLSHHLREWQGQYTMKTERSGVVLLSFSDPKVHKACSDALAGGLRGIFRVERGSAAAAVVAGKAADGGVSGSNSGGRAQQRASSSSSGNMFRAPAGAVSSSSISRGGQAAGWQTVSSSKSKAAAAAAVQLPVSDPWADDDTPGKAAAPALSDLATVADDWEVYLAESEVQVPRGPALQLQQSNMWEALQQAE